VEPFSGEYRLTAAGAPTESGPCSVVVSGPGLELTPRGGISLAVRFAEVATWGAGDHVLWLVLADGTRLELSKLGKRYDELAVVVREAKREHFSGSLLLEEGGGALVERGAYERLDAGGRTIASGPCAVHLQRTSLACFPEVELPFLVSYGAILAADFDRDLYGLVLGRDDGERLHLVRFAKRTDALVRELEERRAALMKRQSAALSALAPELGAMALRRGAAVLRDGVPAGRGELEACAPGLWQALWSYGFSEERRPYAEDVLSRSRRAFVVIKETGPWGASEATPSALADRRLLYLFEVGEALVVEAPSSEDAATYVFRVSGDAAVAARTLCRALAAVQFRREPVYLPDSALRVPPHERYAEASRIVPELVLARASFAGRAIHSSVEAWRKQLDAALSGS
jgi:hypothetical protein